MIAVEPASKPSWVAQSKIHASTCKDIICPCYPRILQLIAVSARTETPVLSTFRHHTILPGFVDQIGESDKSAVYQVPAQSISEAPKPRMIAPSLWQAAFAAFPHISRSRKRRWLKGLRGISPPRVGLCSRGSHTSKSRGTLQMCFTTTLIVVKPAIKLPHKDTLIFRSLRLRTDKGHSAAIACITNSSGVRVHITILVLLAPTLNTLGSIKQM